MSITFHKINNQGISILEVVMSIALLLIVVTALVRLGITTVNTSDASRARSVAQQYADEAMDYLRLIRDQNPAQFFNLVDHYYEWNPTSRTTISISDLASTNCNPTVDSTIGTDCDITGALNDSNVTFYRIINVRGSNGLVNNINSKDVTVYVLWNNSGKYSSVITSTILTKWRS